MVGRQWCFCAGSIETIDEKRLYSWPSVLGDSGICRNRIDPGSYFTMRPRRERRKEQEISACVRFIQEVFFEHLLLCILGI